MLPQAVSDHYRAQQRLIVAALGLTRREWSSMSLEDLDASWAKVGPRVNLLTASAQLGSAANGAAYVAATLDEYGDDIPPLAQVNARAFAGFASDGRPLDSLLEGAKIRAKESQSLTVGGKWLDMAVHTQIADAGRGAAATAIAARPGVGWVRMVNPPCCGPCAVLSGREYRYNQGFQRHPRCDCMHIPTTLANPGSHFGVDPMLDQITDLTEGERRALLEGGDLSRVINARRGGGVGKMTTTELAKRGKVRLTPDGIFAKAGSRDEALRMLKDHGYVVRGGRTVSRPLLAKVAKPKDNPAEVFARAFDGGEPEIEKLGQAYVTELNKVLTARGYSAEVRSAYRADYPGDQINVMTSIKDATGDVVGEQFRSFGRLPDDGGLWARHDFFTLDKAHQGNGLASEMGPAIEDWYRSAGIKHIDLTANVDVGGYTWAKKGYDWSPDAERPVDIMERMADAADGESDKVQQLVGDLYESLAGPRSEWPSPYDLAMAGWEEGATDWLGKRVMLGSEWHGRKVL